MKTILLPVDFSDCVPLVVEAGVSAARAYGAEIILLHIAEPEPEFIGYDPGPQTVRDSVARELASEFAEIRTIEDSIKGKGVKATALVVQGYPVEKILDQAERHDAGLIVMGSHGHGALRNLLVGSVAEGVMRRARCPVLIVPFRE